MATEIQPTNPGVKFPPPFFFLLGLAAAWFLETRVTRIHLAESAAFVRALELLGLALLLAGLVLMLWGLYTFVNARTAIVPFRPATRIVDHGPYGFSRNPMYTGIAMAYLGGALIMNSGWAILTLPLVMLTLYKLVVRREESYLSSAFPDEYSAYRARVRRWL